jgi:hypothetical protein
MKRFLTALIFFMVCGHAFAATDLTKYKDATLPYLTRYLISAGLVDNTKTDVVMDYLKICECDIYKMVKDNPFKQQEVQQAVQKKIAKQESVNTQELFIRIPSLLQITGYNFDTQALNVDPRNQMRRVNNIQLLDGDDQVCDQNAASSVMALPLSYNARLNFPMSLVRIPLKRNIAEAVLPKLDKAQRDGSYIVYTLMYVQIDPVKPDMSAYGSSRIGTMRGQVDAVELYADYDRKVLLKRLNYGENY